MLTVNVYIYRLAHNIIISFYIYSYDTIWFCVYGYTPIEDVSEHLLYVCVCLYLFVSIIQYNYHSLLAIAYKYRTPDTAYQTYVQ